MAEVLELEGQMTELDQKMIQIGFRAAMKRAAEIVDDITTENVVECQMRAVKNGIPFSRASRMDRAFVAAQFLRAISEQQ